MIALLPAAVADEVVEGAEVGFHREAAELGELIAQAKLKVTVDRTFPFDPMVVITPMQIVTIRASMMARSKAALRIEAMGAITRGK